MLQFGVENGYIQKEDLLEPTLEYYAPPPTEKLVDLGVEFHWFGYYHKWVPQDNYYNVSEHHGFNTNPEGHSESTYNKYASLDDLTDPIHYYLSYMKFGIDRVTSDAALEIREGHINREEGVALVHRYDHVFPNRYFQEFLDYMDMGESEFWEVMDAYREKRPNLLQKIGGEWVLQHKLA